MITNLEKHETNPNTWTQIRPHGSKDEQNRGNGLLRVAPVQYGRRHKHINSQKRILFLPS